MRNAGLEEAQAGIKIAGRNINNLRYADDTSLMAESEEELESLSPSSRGSLVPLAFCQQSGFIYISEVDDISPDILDFSL